jgi:hypothetical protein
LDCFAEPVIGRRLAPTRWLAMTKPLSYRGRFSDIRRDETLAAQQKASTAA